MIAPEVVVQGSPRCLPRWRERCRLVAVWESRLGGRLVLVVLPARMER
jgi:hypothetical protein